MCVAKRLRHNAVSGRTGNCGMLREARLGKVSYQAKQLDFFPWVGITYTYYYYCLFY